MSFYEDISVEFQKVSQFFKYGNLRLFQKDMAHYLTDLQFTKGKHAYVYTLKCLPSFINFIHIVFRCQDFFCRKHLQCLQVDVEVIVHTHVTRSSIIFQVILNITTRKKYFILYILPTFQYKNAFQ